MNIRSFIHNISLCVVGVQFRTSRKRNNLQCCCDNSIPGTMGIALNVATASTDREVNSCRDPPVVSSISKSIEIRARLDKNPCHARQIFRGETFEKSKISCSSEK